MMGDRIERDTHSLPSRIDSGASRENQPMCPEVFEYGDPRIPMKQVEWR
jgi:hypothetical protein